MKKNIASILILILFGVALWLVPRPAARTVAFHQYFIEGKYFTSDPVSLDLKNPEAVFQYVFSALDPTVMVYPTENYYYFVLNVNGKPIWGNLHLPPAGRDAGLIDFAFWEFSDNPDPKVERPSYYKRFGRADGVIIKKLTDWQYQVSYQGKNVLFNLNHIPQTPPKNFSLRANEVFTQKTFDESGYSFFLIRNMMPPSFSFVLNDEIALPEPLIPVRKNFWLGKKSGFVFYEDSDDHRKTLIGVSAENSEKNNYYDGPFDQLADNYVQGDEFRSAILAVYPYLAGKIDKYGQFLDRDGARLAISPYKTYQKLEELYDIIKK